MTETALNLNNGTFAIVGAADQLQAADDLSRLTAELAALKAEKLELERREPDAWYADFMGADENDVHLTKRSDWGCKWRPLYLAPGAGSVPMTEGDMFAALLAIDPEAKRVPPGFIEFARAIEAHHNIGVKP